MMMHAGLYPEIRETVGKIDIDPAEFDELMQWIERAARRRYYGRVHKAFRKNHTLEDWRQATMVEFLNLCTNYKPEKGRFAHYIRNSIGGRLTDIQRRICRENPAEDEDVRKALKALQGTHKRTPTHEEVAEATGRTPENVAAVLEEGFGRRKVTGMGVPALDSVAAKAGRHIASPENALLQAELRAILWACIDALESGIRTLFLAHEFEDVPFEMLFEHYDATAIFNANSLSTLKRRYAETKHQVEDCVRDAAEEPATERR